MKSSAFTARVLQPAHPHPGKLNKALNSLRAIGERGNSLLETTFKALRNVGLNLWRIGKIVAAALTILDIDHDRTA